MLPRYLKWAIIIFVLIWFIKPDILPQLISINQTIINNETIGYNSFCGDNMCDSAKGENVQNCPEDCNMNSSIWYYIILIPMIIIFFILIYIYLKLNYKNKFKIKNRRIKLKWKK